MQSYPLMDEEPADLGSQSAANARSYDCSFCKRGFSNAQALGGHMNIHRKDRAKLKQPSDHATLLSFNIDDDDKLTPPPPYPPIIPHNYMPLPLHHHHHGPWVLTQRAQKEKMKLPLFDENPSRRFDGDLPYVDRSGQGTVAEELDLELRLGFEPTDAPNGFKEFI